jgi:hypothetical protein
MFFKLGNKLTLQQDQHEGQDKEECQMLGRNGLWSAQQEICHKYPRVGFMLTEFLVMVVIIAILATILFPIFCQAQGKTAQIQYVSNNEQISSNFVYTSPPLTYVQRTSLFKQLESQWERIRQRHESLSSREIFSFVLRCAEANLLSDRQWLDRVDEALATAEEMQDRDLISPSFGNFRWYYKAEKVEDFNAVEFAMEDATLIWMRHGEKLPSRLRKRLLRLMQFGAEGVKRHRVGPSYTNIYLKKTWNCLALGICLGDKGLIDLGKGMLDNWLLFTWENGISEYLSPTYYGVDLDALLLIAQLFPQIDVRKKAEGALNLFWTDIAANWFEPCKRLGGAHSRDYDYIGGRGYLDEHLRFAGWLDAPDGWIPQAKLLICGWKPSENLRNLSTQNRPRFIYQRWGKDTNVHWASHYNGKKISLGVAGACYGPEDKVLTFQFANGVNAPMGYFVMDARDDPYGKKREITPGGHAKSWHPEPFVASIHSEREAVLLAALDLTEQRFKLRVSKPVSLRSHFVIPREGVEIWVGEKTHMPAESVTNLEIPLNMPVIARYKDTAIGIRIVYATDLDGNTPPITLVNDKNEYGVIRLTVTHSPDVPTHGTACTVAWLRVAEDLDDEAFARFVKAFANATATVHTNGGEIEVKAMGEKGLLYMKANIYTRERLLRADGLEGHRKCLLCINGRDVGRELLSKIEPIATLSRLLHDPSVAEGVNEVFEAEASPLIIPPFEIGEDKGASGGKFVWVSGEEGGRGSAPEARMFVSVRIPKAGKYFVKARVRTPTPEDDSFFIRILRGEDVLLEQTEWHTGVHKDWEWVTLCGKDAKPMELNLPAGVVVIEISCREDGAMLDCLKVTDSP